MINILIIAHSGDFHRWEVELFTRVKGEESNILVQKTTVPRPRIRGLDFLLWLEGLRFGSGLASRSTPIDSNPTTQDAISHNLVIDLTGTFKAGGAPILTVEFQGHPDFAAGMTEMLACGGSLEIVTRLDGVAVGCARPMLSDRLWLTRAGDEMLTGAVSLIAQSVERFQAGRLVPTDTAESEPRTSAKFLPAYLKFAFRGVIDRVQKKLRLGRRPFYWQVAYRKAEEEGVAERGQLDGPSFTVLPDDGKRFYADPFPFEYGGRDYLFVEEFPYDRGKGLISVAEADANGRFGTPRAVLSEPHHLSYPQVFALDGEIFMLPESSAAQELVLYRAVSFPDVWLRDSVLMQDRDFNDATLLVQDGRFWLFGTQRFGNGNASDTMVAYSATSIRGPWRPHARNPIAIDHSAARPGGAFLRLGEALVLPVQNGSEAYGGGLGLMELLRLDDEEVIFSKPIPILPGAALARSGIHTLNRTRKFEVVDSAG